MLKNRREAGILLAGKLEQYKNKENTVVLGIPRGGVQVASEVARILNLPLDIIVIKKVGAPDNEELALGAVGLNNYFLNDEIVKSYSLSDETLKEMVLAKQKEAKERYDFLGSKGYELSGKTVILVDDGVATGATIKMAIQILKSESSKVIVAVPVIAASALTDLKAIGDDVVVLEKPKTLSSIGEFYEEFLQVEDDDVREMLKNAR